MIYQLPKLKFNQKYVPSKKIIFNIITNLSQNLIKHFQDVANEVKIWTIKNIDRCRTCRIKLLNLFTCIYSYKPKSIDVVRSRLIWYTILDSATCFINIYLILLLGNCYLFRSQNSRLLANEIFHFEFYTSYL